MTNFGTKLYSRGAPTNLAKCKLHPIQNFRAPRLLKYTFGDICRHFQPSHLKNHEFHFFTKLPTKPSTYTVVHRQPCPCAKPSELKTFMHQEFNGFIWGHLWAFLTLTSQKPRISFFRKTPHLAHYLCPGAPPTLAMCKTLRTQNFRAPRISLYSFGKFVGLSNPHISKTKNFFFSQNSPPSNLAVPLCTDNLGQVQTTPNSKLPCTKNFMVFIWGHL